MNDLIFTGDPEEDVDGDEPEPEDTIGNEPMTEQERDQLLTVFTALAAEIETRIADFELRLVESYRQVDSDFEHFSHSQYNAVLESLMELRPLIHQAEQRIFHGSEFDASLAIRRLKQRSTEVFLRAEKLLVCESHTTTTEYQKEERETFINEQNSSESQSDTRHN